MANNFKDWRENLAMVYSTNPNFQSDSEAEENLTESIPPKQQKLRIRVERKGRGGKTATIISGFIGSEAELEGIARTLKTFCAVGGCIKENEIVIQGELRDKVKQKLISMGYTGTK